MRLSSFINDVVAKREIPRPPTKYINGENLNLPKVRSNTQLIRIENVETK